MSIKDMYQLILKISPRTDLVDRLIAFFEFVWFHRRLPSHRLLFSDFLYRIKTTEQITDPLRVFVSDKEYVKVFVKAVIGDEYNVPTIKVLKSASEARSYSYPQACCIKPTHMSGEVILRTAGSEIDFEIIDRWFNESHYINTRERNYRSLRPKVIVEPIVFDNLNVTDYKIFCFQGRAKLIQLDLDRHLDHTRKFFDRNWSELPFSLAYPRSEALVPVPDNIEQMITLAEKLSIPFDFVRIDLYSDGEQCLVGEITNCHGNATERFIPPSAEVDASRLIFDLRLDSETD